jgi:hypothetical protein
MNDISIKPTNFPTQKRSMRSKDQDWKEQCINACISKSLQFYPRRSTPRNKQINYDLLNGKFDKREFNYVTNPYCVEGEDFEFPASLEFFDIISPIFNLLFGEDSKRIFTPIAKVVNEDAISSKEEEIRGTIEQMMGEYLKTVLQGQDPALIEEKLSKFNKYTYKDLRERLANHLLKYYTKYGKTTQIFQDGWLDALVAGEELYHVSEVANEPRVRRCNPLTTYFSLPNDSAFMDEADVVVEERYMTLSEILDNFYDILTEDQVQKLEDISTTQSISTSYNMGFPLVPPGENVDSIYALEHNSVQKQGLKLFQCTWKSKKKVGTLYVQNPETGEVEEELVDEFYKPQKGEFIEWFWINEYWSGKKIGDLFFDIHPNRDQYRSMDNMSVCKSGYVGTVYNCQNSQSVSLMDRIKPWIYFFIKIMYRTELLMAANYGKIAKIDLAMIPDGWEIEKWLYYATALKFAFVDSFNQGKEGVAKGMLAGNMSGQSAGIDMELGNSIQNHIALLQYIEQKIQDTSGITRQRMGAISTSELVGNTERAVTQSSHITEKWFEIHNQTKVRVLEQLIETAKASLEGKSKKFQYISDDIETIFFTVDGNEFSNADYGVFVTNSARDLKALETLENLMMTAIQYDKASFSDVLDVMNTDSIADLRVKLKMSEETRMQQNQQVQQAQLQHDQQVEQFKMQLEQSKIDLEKQKLDNDLYVADSGNATKIRVAEINALGFAQNQDMDADGIPDAMEVAAQALDERKHASEHYSKQKELSLKEREISAKEKLEKDKMQNQKDIEDKKLEQIKIQNANQIKLKQMDNQIKEKEIAAKKVIARSKPKPAKK